MYARGHNFSRSDGSGKVYSAYDKNTQTPRTLRTVSNITICLPLGAYNLFVMDVIKQCLNS